MGSEDAKAEASMNKERISSNRLSHGVQQKDFLIVFGGKIDKYKTRVLMLMNAVNTMPDLSVKLLVFGSIVPDMKEAVEKRCSDRVKYLGWATSDQSYDYFGMLPRAAFSILGAGCSHGNSLNCEEMGWYNTCGRWWERSVFGI